jgi:hypothetical protein
MVENVSMIPTKASSRLATTASNNTPYAMIWLGSGCWGLLGQPRLMNPSTLGSYSTSDNKFLERSSAASGLNSVDQTHVSIAIAL